MNITKKLLTFKSALDEIKIDNIFHYYAPSKNKDYIVWTEDGEGDSLHADDRKNEQVITGTIDLFTKIEYNPVVDEVQNALNRNKISFRLESVQFEEETSFIHYEWSFEL